MGKVFISYRAKDFDSILAKKITRVLQEKKYKVFFAEESLAVGEDWPERITRELEECKFFVVLLSKESILSDMVTEEIRRAWKNSKNSSEQKPILIPVRLNLPFSVELKYDIASYLNRIQHIVWNSEEDTSLVLEQICQRIENKEQPPFRASSEEGIPDLQSIIDLPLPTAPLEFPNGQISLSSRYYVERENEEENLRQILMPASLVRIRGPRQFGKTSLLSRLMKTAEDQKHKVISLSLADFGDQTMEDLESFLRELCWSSADCLGVTDRLDEFWRIQRDNKKKCTRYFGDYLLGETTSPVLLAIDEADLLFRYKKVSSQFFSMLRSWHDSKKNNPTWQRLKIAISYSTESYLAIQDINQSPFNVGIPIILKEFTLAQVVDLAERHELVWKEREGKKLMNMIGGHPYLVRKALFEIKKNMISLNQLIRQAPKENGPFGEHLRRHLWLLKQNPQATQTLKEILQQGESINDTEVYLLESAGLVIRENSHINPRFPLYRLFFQDRL